MKYRRELDALGHEALAPRQADRRRQPPALALLVGHDEEDVRDGAAAMRRARSSASRARSHLRLGPTPIGKEVAWGARPDTHRSRRRRCPGTGPRARRRRPRPDHRPTTGLTTATDAHTHRRGLMGLVMSVVVPHDHGAHSGERVLESTSDGIRAVALSLGHPGHHRRGGAGGGATEPLGGPACRHHSQLRRRPHRRAAWRWRSRWAAAPPTRRYTYGFGRAEDLAGVAIVAMIAASTVVAAFEAVIA